MKWTKNRTPRLRSIKLDERVHEWGLGVCGIWSLPYGRNVLHFDPNLCIKIDALDLWAWTKKTELSRKIGSAVMVCLFDHQSMDISIDDNDKVNIAFTGKEPSEYRELKKIAEGEE